MPWHQKTAGSTWRCAARCSGLGRRSAVLLPLGINLSIVFLGVARESCWEGQSHPHISASLRFSSGSVFGAVLSLSWLLSGWATANCFCMFCVVRVHTMPSFCVPSCVRMCQTAACKMCFGKCSYSVHNCHSGGRFREIKIDIFGGLLRGVVGQPLEVHRRLWLQTAILAPAHGTVAHNGRGRPQPDFSSFRTPLCCYCLSPTVDPLQTQC